MVSSDTGRAVELAEALRARCAAENVGATALAAAMTAAGMPTHQPEVSRYWDPGPRGREPRLRRLAALVLALHDLTGRGLEVVVSVGGRKVRILFEEEPGHPSQK